MGVGLLATGGCACGGPDGVVRMSAAAVGARGVEAKASSVRAVAASYISAMAGDIEGVDVCELDLDVVVTEGVVGGSSAGRSASSANRRSVGIVSSSGHSLAGGCGGWCSRAYVGEGGQLGMGVASRDRSKS